jgi:hypothetical protein
LLILRPFSIIFFPFQPANPLSSQVKDNEIRRPSGKVFSMVGKQDGDGLMAALIANVDS